MIRTPDSKMRRASKTEPEIDNITPVSSPHKNKEDTHRELV
jgi:hypothetical protein